MWPWQCLISFSHLDKAGTFVSVFYGFSLAFNTIQPHMLLSRLLDLDISPTTVLWIQLFLCAWKQKVNAEGGRHFSDELALNTDVHQGYMFSPALFSVYTCGRDRGREYKEEIKRGTEGWRKNIGQRRIMGEACSFVIVGLDCGTTMEWVQQCIFSPAFCTLFWTSHHWDTVGDWWPLFISSHLFMMTYTHHRTVLKNGNQHTTLQSLQIVVSSPISIIDKLTLSIYWYYIMTNMS